MGGDQEGHAAEGFGPLNVPSDGSDGISIVSYAFEEDSDVLQNHSYGLESYSYVLQRYSYGLRIGSYVFESASYVWRERSNAVGMSFQYVGEPLEHVGGVS